MNSVILRAAAARLLPLQLIFSLFLLLRGHNLPGGGFAGGLVAAAAFALYAIAFGPAGCRRILPLRPPQLMALGLLLSLTAGAIPLLLGKPFLDHVLVTSVPVPIIGELALGTVLLFDSGVYLLVIAAVLAFLLNLQESD